MKLCETGMTWIIRAIGFRPHYSQMKVDLLDERGKPLVKRGVIDECGLYVIGLRWLNTAGAQETVALTRVRFDRDD